jgi:hypothetical protein
VPQLHHSRPLAQLELDPYNPSIRMRLIDVGAVCARIRPVSSCGRCQLRLSRVRMWRELLRPHCTTVNRHPVDLSTLVPHPRA